MEDEIYVEGYPCIKTRGTCIKICEYYVYLYNVYIIMSNAVRPMHVWECTDLADHCRTKYARILYIGMWTSLNKFWFTAQLIPAGTDTIVI